MAGTGWFYPAIYTHDLLISVVIALPLAAIVYCLRPERYLVYLAVAILPGFVWNNFIAVENFTFFRGWYWLAILAMELFSVPVALLLIHKIRGAVTPPNIHSAGD